MATDKPRKHEWMEYDAHMYCSKPNNVAEKHHWVPKASQYNGERTKFHMECYYCGTHYIPDLHNPPADYEPL